MANITHQVGVKDGIEKVRRALTEPQDLAHWWTQEVTGSGQSGGELQFRFNGPGMDMKVIANQTNHVEWECTAGPEEWLGTHIRFDLKPENTGTSIFFKHAGWREETPFHYHCSMKWAVFLLSLKHYLDTGTGKPFPNDWSIAADC